jgi:hypothetical protein
MSSGASTDSVFREIRHMVWTLLPGPPPAQATEYFPSPYSDDARIRVTVRLLSDGEHPYHIRIDIQEE